MEGTANDDPRPPAARELPRRTLDALPRAVVAVDVDGAIALWNDTAAALYGWSEGEVLGRSIEDVLPPDDPGDADAMLVALAEGATWTTHRRVRRRDGTEVQILASTTALFGPDGEIDWVVGVSEDLAHIRTLEAQARLLDDHLRLALDAGGLGTWRWDRTSGVTMWDERMEQLFGLAPGSFDGTFDAWVALLHSDDRDEVLATVERAVDDRSPYRLEHRVVTPGGEVRWIEGAGDVTVDERGEVTGTIGCSRDITDRAATDAEHRRLVAQLRTSVQRERVQRSRLELVAAVNQALDSSGSLRQLMRDVAAAVVPRLGDWCTVHLLAGPGATVPDKVTAHVDPGMVERAEALRDRLPYEPDGQVWIPRVIRTGTSELYTDLGDAMRAAPDLPEGVAELLDELDLRSALAVPINKGERCFGALEFVMAGEHRHYTEEDRTLAEAIAARIAATLDNRRLREQRDRTARIDADLAELGRKLVGAADVDAVVEVALTTAAIIGAATVHVGLVSDAEHIDVLGPGTLHAGRDRRLEAIDAGTRSPLADAVRSGERIFTVTEQDRPSSMVVSPLLSDERRSVGLLIFTWDGIQAFDEIDTNAIETLSRLCGQALRRTQAAGETLELAAMARSLAVARTTFDVAEQLQAHGSQYLGATVANLRILDVPTGTLRSVAPSRLPAAVMARYEQIRLDDDLPLSDAARTNRAVWLRDLAEYRLRYPDAADDVASAGLSAVASIPLHDSDGQTIGVVTFGWAAGMHFDHRFRDRIATLCELAAQTLERVRLYESEHVVVAAMQRQLLPALPDHDGIELATYYEPASLAVGMGGDWYEAFGLDDGSLVAVIGDVVGHGVEAVAAMARLQHLINGLVRTGTPFEDLFARLDSMASGTERTFATAALLHLDPAAGRLGYQLAGHPGPLLRGPDGTVEVLSVRRQRLLGMGLEPAAMEYVDLPAGAVVLAYTDGLIERRGEPIDESIERLARHLEGAELGADLTSALARLVADVHHEAGPEPTADDVAAILLRIPPAT